MRRDPSHGAHIPGTLLMFWDYDTQWGRDRSRLRRDPGWQGIDEFTCTERLLELHGTHNVPACFAVVASAALPGERPYHDPDQIRAIHAAGHEVASHTMRHEWIPGLSPLELRDNLRSSRRIIEECIGAPVTTLVPPYNRPFDCPPRWSISIAERREAGRVRTSLPGLCEALAETGYTFCRVAYRPFWERWREKLTGRQRHRPSRLERIASLSCLRLNCPRGFDQDALAVVERVVREGGCALAWGHPHALIQDGSEHQHHVATFLARVAALRASGDLDILTPRGLLAHEMSTQARP